MQELDNGITAVTYTKEDSGNDAEPRTSTIVKTQIIYFYLYNGSANPPLLAEYLETSKWAYGGSVGTTPYFSSASYEIRYVNFDYGVTAWGTPQMIHRHSSSDGTVTYDVKVELTVNGVTSTYTSGTYTLTFS